MDPEKSSNSSFEDLSNLNEGEKENIQNVESETLSTKSDLNVETPEVKEKEEDELLDVIGNGQLTKKTVKKADTDIQPQRGDLVTINYTGKLSDGTVVEQEENFKIHVGDFEVVQGLDMVIPLMRVGEIAEVFTDQRFAYGTVGLSTEKFAKAPVPPHASINYTVELVACKFEEFDDLKSYEIRKEYGNRKRERANFWYNRNEFNTAIQIYRRALEFLDHNDGDPDSVDGELGISIENLQSLLDDRLIVYNNLAMAQIKVSAYDAALASVENVLRCQPNNSKALYRKGRILDAKCDTKGAIALLQKAATLEPDSKTIQQDLAKLIIKQRREEHNEKEMYQKMLGQAKKLENKPQSKQRPPSTDVTKLKLLGYIMGSILIGVAGVAMYRYKY
ncbi:FKBP8 family protein [Megaselia abdita]